MIEGLKSFEEGYRSGHNGAVSKTAVLARGTRVRIPPLPPRITFRKIKVGCLGAKRLGMVFPRENPSIFEGERKRPLGNAEVRTNYSSFAQKQIFFLLNLF